MNPKQFQKHVDIFNKKESERMMYDDKLNHLLGQYIVLAIHDPGSYPKDSFLSQANTSSDRMSDYEMEKMARRNTIMLGGDIVQ
ncbi:hypothetical protein PT250_02660 [Erysipelothrix rhusiopathiae]|uniref:hypothetical protein n=3 Tax=Erysipelothrix rhusiopathiae TaxID=1648 RepID=UPI0023AF7B8C|nr:hypothetical protein [Erysipelothrix rhusiopathiae]MDE8245453.1 hypothetical protein [Erysipelothrix rhusiopathiae]MDE8248880.1 hypothetical protein [Erysipelothrix rhusiopathiae]MDE8341012.1 hypothetical protein [Erysipelothrix rhusiopathiae]